MYHPTKHEAEEVAEFLKSELPDCWEVEIKESHQGFEVKGTCGDDTISQTASNKWFCCVYASYELGCSCDRVKPSTAFEYCIRSIKSRLDIAISSLKKYEKSNG